MYEMEDIDTIIGVGYFCWYGLYATTASRYFKCYWHIDSINFGGGIDFNFGL